MSSFYTAAATSATSTSQAIQGGGDKGKMIACDNTNCPRGWFHFGGATQFHPGLATCIWSLMLTHLDALLMVLTRLWLNVQGQDFVYKFGILLSSTSETFQK